MKRALVVLVLAAAWLGVASGERLRAPDGTVREVPDESVPYALKDGYERLGTAYYRDTSGRVVTLYDEAAAHEEAAMRGWWRMTADEIADYEARRAAERDRRFEREHAGSGWTESVVYGLFVLAILGGVYALLVWRAK